MAQVTAKVVLNSKLESGVGSNRQIAATFSADYAGGKNKEWAIYTPILNLTMTMKGEVADLFKVGQEITLIFDLDEETKA